MPNTSRANDALESYIEVVIDTQSPPLAEDLGDFLKILASRFNKHSDNGRSLVIRRVRHGSILIELAIAGTATLIGLAAGYNTLSDFAKNLVQDFGALKSGRYGLPPERPVEDLGVVITRLLRSGGTVSVKCVGSGGTEISGQLASADLFETRPMPLAYRWDGSVVGAESLNQTKLSGVIAYPMTVGYDLQLFIPSVSDQPLPFSEGIGAARAEHRPALRRDAPAAQELRDRLRSHRREGGRPLYVDVLIYSDEHGPIACDIRGVRDDPDDRDPAISLRPI